MSWPRPSGPGPWRGRLPGFLCAHLAAATLGVAPAVSAQTVQGHLRAGDPPGPVTGAFVLLVDSAGVVRRATVSDSTGAFRLLAPHPGRYRLEVRHPAYARLRSDPLPVRARPALRVDLHVPRHLFTLPPVTIVAAAPAQGSGVLAGFYRRMARGWGYFITREEIERRGAHALSDLLVGIPDVRVIRRSDVQSTVRMGTELARVNLGPLSLGEDGTPRVAVDARLPCSPLIYVNGLKFGRADEVFDQASPSEIEGIEIYRRASELPPEFGGLYARCGLILIWTRRHDGGG